MNKVWMIVVLFVLSCRAMTQSAPAKVVVIGTMHTPNNIMHADSLLSILKVIQPDVLLIETDTLSSYFKGGYQLIEPPGWYKRASKLKLARRMPPEHEVMYAYRDIKPNVVLLPFDIAIADRKKYKKEKDANEARFLQALNALSASSVSDYRKQVHNQYVQLNNTFVGIHEQGYHAMNQPAITRMTSEMMQLEATHYTAIMDSVASMAQFKPAYMEERAFWDKRNKTMAENILRFVAQYPGKTFVVFTGLLHKYYLMDLLQGQQQAHHFELKEYFDMAPK
jgi:pheromone shutdown protein TraB